MIILIIQKDKESRPENFDFVNISETFCWKIIISNLFPQSSNSARSGNKLITRRKSGPIFVISTLYNFTVTIRIWFTSLRNYFTGSSHECFKFCEKYYQSQFWNYLDYWKTAIYLINWISAQYTVLTHINTLIIRTFPIISTSFLTSRKCAYKL